jgi:hypothetical protein
MLAKTCFTGFLDRDIRLQLKQPRQMFFCEPRRSRSHISAKCIEPFEN